MGCCAGAATSRGAGAGAIRIVLDSSNQLYPDCWFPCAGNNSPQIAPPTGAPAITVPMGYARDVAQAPLPAGLQMLGRPWDEARLLRLAYAFEQATQYRR